MSLGYDGKLYILAFDHRGSFQKKMFGIEGDPTPEETDTIADAKHLIYEGMVRATETSDVPADTLGVLVDEQFGAPHDVPGDAKAKGLKLAMPVEKSGQDTFDFEYGDDFGAHIEKFDPDFSKVLVRYNPDGDADANRTQLEKLKRLADWLHDNGRLFLHELLVPATDAQLESVLEIATEPCRNTAEAGEQLRGLRRLVREVASQNDLAIGAAGTHPFAMWEDQRIVARPRYRDLISALRFVARQEVTLEVERADGSRAEVTAVARIDGPAEVEYFRHGGILQMVLRQLMDGGAPA